MENKLHILFLPRWYPNRHDSMYGLFVKRHAEAAAQLNDVSVVYVQSEDRKLAGLEAVRSIEDGVLTFRLYYKHSHIRFGIGKLINAIRFYQANVKGIKLVQKERGAFQLVHVHILTRLAIIALWLKWKLGIPYIITEHWSRYLPTTGSFKGNLRKWFTRQCVQRAAMVTTVTQNLANAMQSHGLHNRNYRILPNVVDVELFKPTVIKSSNLTRIIHISCFEDRSKNISGILKVLSRLKSIRTDFHCTMVGDGEDFVKLNKLADSLGLIGRYVEFTGVLEGKALVSELTNADCLLLFSHYENLPVVIPESFSCGVPVISSKVGGIAELVNDSNGILVEPGNEEALLQALVNLLDKSYVFDQEAMRHNTIQTNSMDNVGALLNSWYRLAIK